MATETKVLNELKAIKVELDYIKENMPNKEMFLTTEEKTLLTQSYENERAGKLVSSKDLKKQLEL